MKDASQDDAADDEDVVAAWLSGAASWAMLKMTIQTMREIQTREEGGIRGGAETTTPATAMNQVKIHQRHKIHYQKRMKKIPTENEKLFQQVLCERTSFH
jgi:hypothetical protein